MNESGLSGQDEQGSQLDSRLRQLDRLANTGTLAASMAHEIKNSLVAVRVFIDLLLEKNQDAELAQVVRREMGRIDGMINRMLKFAVPSTPSFADVRLHEVLEHSLRLVQPQMSAKSLKVERAFSAASDLICGDEYELQQAFVNLLLNAIDATAPHGSVTVSTELGDGLPAEQPGATSKCIRVCFVDTGEGISPENLGRLFDPFFTTKASGTGLGLAVTRRVVQEHKGRLSAHSQRGQGSTFTIVLPASAAGDATAAAK